MPSLGIGHRAGCTIGKSRTYGSRWRRRQMCCRRVCGSTPGDWGSNNPVLALSLRRCRTTAYTSSAVPRFTNMLLSPRPFGSRSVVRLGVMDPELRPPLVAIPSVRDTAHTFTAHGAAPLFFSMATWTTEASCFPFRQPPQSLHRGQLARSLGTFVPSSPKARGLRRQFSSWCTQLSWAQTPMPHPTFPVASGFRWGLPYLLSTPLRIHHKSPVFTMKDSNGML